MRLNSTWDLCCRLLFSGRVYVCVVQRVPRLGVKLGMLVLALTSAGFGTKPGGREGNCHEVPSHIYIGMPESCVDSHDSLSF